MYKSVKIRWKKFIPCMLAALGTGVLSAAVTGNFDIYSEINKPDLSPPPIVFPIVWTILFTLMGISSYMISVSENRRKKKALAVYGIQLFFNFLWPVLFFRARVFTAAFIWLIILWLLVLWMIILFRKIKNAAGLLQIPYLLWLTFAAYLNYMVVVLN